MQDYFESAESVEARAIMRLVSLGTTTLENARDLIAIPQREGSALDAFVAISGKAGIPIGRAIAFRRRVSSEFEKLVAARNADEQASLELAFRKTTVFGSEETLNLAS